MFYAMDFLIFDYQYYHLILMKQSSIGTDTCIMMKKVQVFLERNPIKGLMAKKLHLGTQIFCEAFEFFIYGVDIILPILVKLFNRIFVPSTR